MLWFITEMVFWEHLSRRPGWDATRNWSSLSCWCFLLAVVFLFSGYRTLGIGCGIVSAIADIITVLWVLTRDSRS